jgi:hypothetical protein
MATTPNKTNLTGNPTQAQFKTELNNFVDYTVATEAELQTHESNTNNPHGVTCTQIGAVPTSNVSAGTTAGTIPQRDSNGKLAGDILGNAATATSATNAATANNASLLQGYTAAQVAALAQSVIAQSLTPNGYVKFANGFTIQWGSAAYSTRQIIFPTPFSNAVFGVFLQAVAYNNWTNYPKVTEIATNYFSWYGDNVDIRWFAIGY